MYKNTIPIYIADKKWEQKSISLSEKMGFKITPVKPQQCIAYTEAGLTYFYNNNSFYQDFIKLKKHHYTPSTKQVFIEKSHYDERYTITLYSRFNMRLGHR